MLSARGVKPLSPYQHCFKNFYLFGSFSPITGDSFFLELPGCTSDSFQLYLNEFSLQKPEEFKVLFLDNGAFQHAKSLSIPRNIALIFLPPYSPELNPAEKIGRHLKDALGNTLLKTLDALSDKLTYLINDLTAKKVISITAYKCYLDALMTTFSV